MKKILLVSGDSFTAEKFISFYHHDLDTSWPRWPTILAEKLDMDYINLGISGAGNEYIYTSLLDKIITMNPDNIGLIISAWSHVKRKDYKIRNEWKHPGIVRNELNELIDESAHCPSPSTYSTHAGDTQFQIDQSIKYYYSLQEICKSKKLPLRQIQMISAWDYYEDFSTFKFDSIRQEIIRKKNKQLLKYFYDNPYFNKMDDNFIGWPLEKELGGFTIEEEVIEGYKNDSEFLGRYKVKEGFKWSISEKDNHPNAKGQEKIAEFLYDRLGKGIK